MVSNRWAAEERKTTSNLAQSIEEGLLPNQYGLECRQKTKLPIVKWNLFTALYVIRREKDYMLSNASHLQINTI